MTDRNFKLISALFLFIFALSIILSIRFLKNELDLAVNGRPSIQSSAAPLDMNSYNKIKHRFN